MEWIARLIFTLLCMAGTGYFAYRMYNIRKIILLGQEEVIKTTTDQRLKNLFLLALGQKKMFQNPVVAILHLIIYAGFIIINIELLEILLDGLLGKHRMLAPVLGTFYPVLINAFEILAVLVILVCVIFLTRRNILKLKRFISNDLNGWPRSDANWILISEIVLMSLFLFMNTADGLLQMRGSGHYAEVSTGPFIISGIMQPLLESLSNNQLVMLERTCWWLHIAGIFAFLNYLPYSKHLHILLAFPNAWYAQSERQGTMTDMPAIRKEVALALGQDIQNDPVLQALPDAPPDHFGAKDIFDLSWKNLLDAYSCTECGRCSTACPANMTGKLLSPRAIMMKTRDRAEQVGQLMAKGNGTWNPDGKTLLHDYISPEELRACTTCQACVEACPVSISPLDIILKMRRYLILDESNSPGEWNAMFGNIENNFAPWKFNAEERLEWTKD